jgi:hypothetical protein
MLPSMVIRSPMVVFSSLVYLSGLTFGPGVGGVVGFTSAVSAAGYDVLFSSFLGLFNMDPPLKYA